MKRVHNQLRTKFLYIISFSALLFIIVAVWEIHYIIHVLNKTDNIVSGPELLNKAYAVAWQLIGIAIIIVLGTWYLLDFYLKKHLVKPLAELKKRIEEYGPAFEPETDHDTNGEGVHGLNRSFTTLTRRLDRSFSVIQGYAKQLEQQVDERTKELSIANEQLNQLLQEKRNFIRVLGHDLRGPFSSLINYPKQIKHYIDKNDIETAIEIAGDMRLLAKQTYDLLEEILYGATVENVALTAKFTIVEAASVAERAYLLTKSLAEQKGIKLSLICETGQKVWGDPTSLCQVLLNFINNGIKFTNSGGHVTVRVLEQAGQIRFEVQDTGMGMPEVMLHALQHSFKNSNLSGMGTDGECGTSFGLKICHSLVDAHGGKCGVDSQEHIGSVFWLSLPKYEPDIEQNCS